MPRIESYYARERVEPQTLPRAPARQLADTGQGLEAKAIAGVGGALQKVSQQLAEIEAERQRARDNVSLAEMKGELDDFEYTSVPDATQITDIEDFKKLEEKYAKDWKKKTSGISKGKSRRVSDHFKIYTELHWDRARLNYHRRVWPMEKDYATVKFNELWALKFPQYVDNPARLKTELESVVNQFSPYLRNPEQIKAGIDEKVIEYQKRDMLNKLHETAKGMSYTNAITFLNDVEGIERAERNDLITRRKRQNEIETATTNRKVRWDTLRKVTKDPESITDEMLESLVKPNSLTWDDAEEFKKIRDTKNHPLKSARSELYLGILDALYPEATKPGRVDKIDLDRVLEYDKKNEELKNYFEANPDVTPEQAKKFFDELTVKPKSDWLGRLWEGFIIGTGGRGLGLSDKTTKTGEPEAEDIRFEAVPQIEFDEIWPTLTETQKGNVYKALGNRYTVDEILSSLEK